MYSELISKLRPGTYVEYQAPDGERGKGHVVTPVVCPYSCVKILPFGGFRKWIHLSCIYHVDDPPTVDWEWVEALRRKYEEE